jgi:hypothetical protein
MSAVTVQEVIERLEGLGNPKALDLIKRISTHGIAPPDGMKIVPIEPTVEQIEEGAKGIASWEADCIWPVSWSNSQVLRMRKDARSAYVAMLAAAPKQESE